ncbi:MAG: ATPase, T2SS/T4P/T4SS family [Gemmataceae bacterium]
MATPNDPKKPTPPQGVPPRPAQPGAPRPAGVPPKPGVPQQARPAAPGTPGAKPGAVPAKPGAVPAKPGAVPAKPGQGAPPQAKGLPPGKAPVKKPVAKAKDTGGGGRRKIGQVLIDLGFIDEDQLWEILEEAKSTGQLTGQVAVARGLINEDQLIQALAEQNNLKVMNLSEVKPTAEALQLVPETMASVYKVLPISFKDKVLTVAIGDPANLPALDDLRNLLNINEVVAQLASANAINELLAKIYQGKEESIIDLIQEIENNPTLGGRKAETSIDLESMVEMAEAAPVRKLINMVFLLGIRDKASDIHFEPFEDEYKIRMRADGVLYEMVPPPRHLATAISSRIKVMANLDIAERRMPQDGRIELNVGGNQVDLRVSVLPTMFGESVVVRVLDRTVVSLDLNKIGMDPRMLEEFRGLIAKPNGIVLVTGPTGAGKTTTLYSALNELNVITDKIITTEDPVEYDIDGIVQCPINHEIGLTFASALRAILRQDPDKILVGEIRDLETAQIAVQAALTGHIVFSTLHTNDAPSTITRLRDMGLEPFLITATVEAVLAQRLVRRICVDCRTEFEPSPDMLMELNLTPADVRGKKFYYGRGCDRCNNTGHKGRMGLYELLVVNDDIRDLISQGVSVDELTAACRKSGMVTLRDSGLRAIFDGSTTIEEVVRETVVDDK